MTEETIDKLTKQELKDVEEISKIDPNMYLYHNNLGEITALSNIKPEAGDYLEVPKEKLVDFLSGKKNISRYKIDYFKFKDKDNTPSKGNVFIPKDLIYTIPFIKKEDSVDVLVTHSKREELWYFSLSDNAKALVQSQNLDKTYQFFVIKDEDLNFLISTIEIRGSDLLSDKSVPFSAPIEKHVYNVSIVTTKDFESYGLLINE
jgi:hypothetical protein